MSGIFSLLHVPRRFVVKSHDTKRLSEGTSRHIEPPVSMRAETPEGPAAADVEAAVAAGDAADASETRRGDSERVTPVGVCRVCLQEVSLSLAKKNGVDGSDAGSLAARPVVASGDDVVLLGCACSQPCHRACMEAWTRAKGDRTCELCHETMLSLPSPPPRRDDALNRQPREMAVFVRRGDDEAGGHVIFALADPGDDPGEGAGRPARVFVRRFRGPAGDDADETDGFARGRRARRCSECVSLLAFAAVFVLVFGGPGLVLAGIYVLWFVWLRAVTG